MDEDHDLKIYLAERYPKLDEFMIDVCIKNHKKMVELYGEDYDEQQQSATGALTQQVDKNLSLEYNDTQGCDTE